MLLETVEWLGYSPNISKKAKCDVQIHTKSIMHPSFSVPSSVCLILEKCMMKLQVSLFTILHVQTCIDTIRSL